MTKSILKIFIVFVLVGFLFSCNNDTAYTIGIELVKPIDQDPFQMMKTIEFDVVNAEDSKQKYSYNFESSAGFGGFNTSLDSLDYFPLFELFVQGLDPEGNLYSRGKTGVSAAATLTGSTIAIYFAKAGSITLPPAQLLHKRAGVKLVSPNSNDVLIVGGADRDKDGTWQDSVKQVALFSQAVHRMDVLNKSDDIYLMGLGLLGHTATIIDTSSILVAGGYSVLAGEKTYQQTPIVISSTLADLEVEVTELDKFTPRTDHRSTYIMKTSHVLTCGGFSENDKMLDDCFFIQANNTYDLKQAFKLATPRANHSQTLLLDSDYNYAGVLFYGGNTDKDVSAEFLISDATDTITLQSPTETRTKHAALTLGKNRVLITGGLVDDVASKTALLFDASCIDKSDCKSFTKLDDFFITARYNHTLTAYSKTHAIACGGFDAQGLALLSCEIISLGDDNQNEIKVIESIDMVHKRAMHDAQFLPDNTVMLVGGFNEDEGALDSIEIFMPSVL